ncbi:MAG: ABC transporter permease [Rothia sp. (in: high G+C Gram-positive bacteria)]|nr:ABC transporter permease [Rothia sp. (in: high G+C Gram-positive bacteria)]
MNPNVEADRAAPVLKRLVAQGRYELVAMLKNAEQLMLNIAFPVMALFAMVWTSFIDSYAQEINSSRVDAAVPGVLALCLISTALSGQGIATGFDRRYGVLRFLSTTPLGQTGLILGKILAVLAVLMLQFLVIGSAALLLGWRPNFISILLSIPTMLLGAAAFTALGLLIAGTVRAEATLAIVNMAWVLLAAGGGTLLPVSHYPAPLEQLASILPSGALGTAFRAEFSSQEFMMGPHLILMIWTLACGLLARRYFKWSS